MFVLYFTMSNFGRSITQIESGREESLPPLLDFDDFSLEFTHRLPEVLQFGLKSNSE